MVARLKLKGIDGRAPPEMHQSTISSSEQSPEGIGLNILLKGRHYWLNS